MKSSDFKISFVIPAYNEELYLAGCLESILREIKDYPFSSEVIVVNNGSIDKTKEIALLYSSVRVVDEPKKGSTKARQAGYLAAKGDLIANIDADSMIKPGWLKKVFYEFSKNDSLICLSGPVIYYDLSFYNNFRAKIVSVSWYVTDFLLRVFFKKGGMLQGANFVVKKSALQKIGGYNTEIDFYGDDTELASRLRAVGKLKFDFELKIYTSGRRIINEGGFMVGMRYIFNYFSILFLGKPYTLESIDVRIKTGRQKTFKESVKEFKQEFLKRRYPQQGAS